MSPSSNSADRMAALVESDETFIGANPYKIHKDRKAKLHERRGQGMRGNTYVGKTAVFRVL